MRGNYDSDYEGTLIAREEKKNPKLILPPEEWIENNQWIYDENSWKIMVSSRSPGMKVKGKHIDNVTKAEKEVYLDYIHSKGYKLGKSEFKKVDQNHTLQDNERWFENKPVNKSDKRLLEIITEEGVSNRYELRDEMNIIYFLDLEASRPKWPWAFKVKEVQDGFFK